MFGAACAVGSGGLHGWSMFGHGAAQSLPCSFSAKLTAATGWSGSSPTVVAGCATLLAVGSSLALRRGSQGPHRSPRSAHVGRGRTAGGVPGGGRWGAQSPQCCGERWTPSRGKHSPRGGRLVRRRCACCTVCDAVACGRRHRLAAGQPGCGQGECERRRGGRGSLHR